MEMLAPKNKSIMKRNIGRDAIKEGVKRKQGVLGRMHDVPDCQFLSVTSWIMSKAPNRNKFSV